MLLPLANFLGKEARRRPLLFGKKFSTFGGFRLKSVSSYASWFVASENKQLLLSRYRWVSQKAIVKCQVLFDKQRLVIWSMSNFRDFNGLKQNFNTINGRKVRAKLNPMLVTEPRLRSWAYCSFL